MSSLESVASMTREREMLCIPQWNRQPRPVFPNPQDHILSFVALIYFATCTRLLPGAKSTYIFFWFFNLYYRWTDALLLYMTIRKSMP